jgi:hypothetical protein
VEHEAFHKALQELNVLYAKTKDYILRAEELDPSCRSNISVFKEQRDALDHVMRGMFEHFEKKGNSASDEYILQQISDAKGHLFRAAYDALDGMGVSYKLKLSKATKNIPNEAIAAVYPKYYEVIPEIEKVEERIVQHRKNKDQRRTTIEELDAYCSSIETIDGYYKEVFGRIPLFVDWQRKDKKRFRSRLLVVPLIFLLIGGAVTAGFTILKEKYFPSNRPAAGPSSQFASPTPTPTQVPSVTPITTP